MATESVTYKAADGSTINASASIAVPSGNPLANLPLKPWYGGPAYWAKFPNAKTAGWTDPSFFPLGVYFGKPEHAANAKAAGINTYVGIEHTGAAMSSVTSVGLSVIAQDEWSASELGSDPKVVGHYLADEIEMDPSYKNDAARLAALQKFYAAENAKKDGRFSDANFSKGILETYWAPGTMAKYVAATDVSSVDNYAYTSPGVNFEFGRSDAWKAGKKNSTADGSLSAYTYGWQIDQLDKFSNSQHPSWIVIESARPYLTEAGARTIKPVKMEGAVWQAIIHGAAGVVYFQHNNDSSIPNYSITDPKAPASITNMTKQIAAQVGKLAPVINTQTYVWSFGPNLSTALKAKDGLGYIFAMTDGGTGPRTFTLPPGVKGAVTVVDENRTLDASSGSFTDMFAAEYTHHIYSIPLT